MTFFLGTQILKNAIINSIVTSGSQPTRHKIKNTILIELDKWEINEPSHFAFCPFQVGLSQLC